MTTLFRSKANAARIGRESRVERRQASNADVSGVSRLSRVATSFVCGHAARITVRSAEHREQTPIFQANR